MINFISWIRENIDEEVLHIKDMRELFRGKVASLYPFSEEGWGEMGIQHGGHKLWARGEGWYIGIVTPQLLIRRPPREVAIVLSDRKHDIVVRLPISEKDALRSHEIVELLDKLIQADNLPEECLEAFSYLLGAYWYFEGRL